MPSNSKAALKALREQRGEFIERAKQAVKRQQKDIRALKALMGGQGATVPEMAKETGIPADLVLWYVATLRKYGEVAEGDKDGDYFRYHLA